MAYNNIKIEFYEKVALIRFINTDKLNPLNIETSQELSLALDKLKTDQKIRAIIITGSGRSFSAGGDIKGMLKSIEDGTPDKYMDNLTKEIYGITIQLRKYPKPIIAAVNGFSIGAGMNLALSCDLIIASEEAKFAESFSKLGLIPGALGTHLLINQISWQKAAEFCFLGKMISPNELLKLGLINKVVPAEDLEKEALKLANELANGPTLAYARTKKLFLEALTTSFEEHLEKERQEQVLSALTQDYKIGVKAINQKEKPKFIGK
ncbi:MAG: enoyl-CoA hydratase/isomerase family protein [Candidatus Helarchaeota archaeon]